MHKNRTAWTVLALAALLAAAVSATSFFQPEKKNASKPPAEPVRFIGQLYFGDVDLHALERSAQRPRVKPGYLKIGSGAGWQLRWVRWGGPTAVGVGRYHNHEDVSTGTVILSRPYRCGRYRLYTFMRPRYNTPPPPGWTRPTAVSIERSCY